MVVEFDSKGEYVGEEVVGESVEIGALVGLFVGVLVVGDFDGLLVGELVILQAGITR